MDKNKLKDKIRAEFANPVMWKIFHGGDCPSTLADCERAFAIIDSFPDDLAQPSATMDENGSFSFHWAHSERYGVGFAILCFENNIWNLSARVKREWVIDEEFTGQFSEEATKIINNIGDW